MFSVIFEVQPRSDQWHAYLDYAKELRPELERVVGFIDNIRYASLTRDGWILSLSNWRDEKALVRWRTMARHHEVQEKGRSSVLLDYHLRVGQLTRDTRLPEGRALPEARLDETEVGDATTITLVDAKRAPRLPNDASAADIAAYLGLDQHAAGLAAWDIFDAVLTPGDLILLMAWRTLAHAEAFETVAKIPPDGRLRSVRVVRDYGKYDRREAPQYYPDVSREPAG